MTDMTFRMNRRVLLAMGGLAACGLLVAVPGQAGMSIDRTTELTFSKPVALPGVTLGAGTYIFERAAPSTAIEIVRVSSKDRRFVYFMGYTRLVARPRGSNASITFSEAPAGAAVPIAAWYPTATSTGHQFLYR
jgi:hypothetical protein